MDNCKQNIPTKATLKVKTAILKFNNNKCFICHGSKGSCFEGPLCAFCHDSLYPKSPAKTIIRLRIDNVSGFSDQIVGIGAEEFENSSNSTNNDNSKETENSCTSTNTDECDNSSTPTNNDNSKEIENFCTSTNTDECDNSSTSTNNDNSEETENSWTSTDSDECDNSSTSTNSDNSDAYENASASRDGCIEEDLAQQISTLQLTTIENLPLTVILQVFDYLDPISLWNAAKVCTSWQAIIQAHTKPELWMKFTLDKWPLLAPMCDNNTDWLKLCSAMLDSCWCIKCVRQMSDVDTEGMVQAWHQNRIMHELEYIEMKPLEGIKVTSLDSRCFQWQVSIEGPDCTPYEGGLFMFLVQISRSYGGHTPIIRCLTKIFHPNISKHGDMDADYFYDKWSSDYPIYDLLSSIRRMLRYPHCEVYMEPAVTEMYINERSKFEEQALMWTKEYAQAHLMSYN